MTLRRTCLAWVALGLFIIGISSIQLFPTAEMVMHSSRGSGIDYTEFSSGSLPLKRLPELFVPNFSGYIDFLPYTEHYWGVALTDGDDYPYILNIYFGCIAILLGTIGGLAKRGNDLLPRKLRTGLFLLFLGSVILSVGRSLPFFQLLYRVVPLISLFRYPIKFLLAGIFPLALLAGYAAERYLSANAAEPENRQNISKILLSALWGLSLLFGGTTLLFSLSTDFADIFQTFFFQQPGGELMFHSLHQSLLHASVMLVVFTLLMHYRRCAPKTWQGRALVFLVAADVLSAGIRVNVTASEEFFTDRPPIVQTVEQHIGDGRLLREKNPENIQLFAPSNEVVWGYRWNLETLDHYLGAFYHIPVLFHDDYVGLGQNQLMSLKSLIERLPLTQKLPILSAGGITTLLTTERLSLPGIQYIAKVPNRSNVDFHLYRNTRALPHIFFVTEQQMADSDREALQMMLDPGYDPHTTVLLQSIAPSFLTSLFSGGMFEQTIKFTEAPDTDCQHNAHVETLLSNSHEREYSLSTACDGFLVFSEPFYPGWNVSIEGKQSELFRANVAFSAAFMPRGTHKVRHFYRPYSLKRGAIASLLFCMVFIGIFIKWPPR